MQGQAQAHIIALIIAAVVAWWVHMDALKRGKKQSSALIWAIGSFLLMIVFLPLWLITRPKEFTNLKNKNLTGADTNLMICNECNRDYNEQYGFIYCPYCGSRLDKKNNNTVVEKKEEIENNQIN